jgi:glutathione S-transferase
MFLLPENKRDPSKVLKAKEQVFLLLNILNNQLIYNNYILGNEFSLADIPAGCWYNRCKKFNFDFSKFDGINQWFSKLQKREAYNSNVISAPLPPN